MLHRKDEECIELNQKYETIFNNIHDAVFLIQVDENNNFYYELLNSTQKKLTGLKNKEIQQKTPEQLLGEELGTEIEANCRKCLQQKEVISYQRTINLPSGKKIWATKLSPVIIDGKVVQIAGSSRDITEIKAKEEKIEYISFHDELTGLYNRRYYEEEIKRLDTKRKLPISLIVGDVNGLKLTNDVFGHEIGDELLKKAGQVLQESTRHEDIVARWGGDEYCIILPQTNTKEAQQIVKRITNNCTEIDSASIPLSIEFGVATKTDLEKDMNQVFAEAEENMYQKKKREKCKFDNKLLNALLKKLKQSNYEVVNHTNRMLELADRFAERLKFSPERKRLLCKAVQFHDIGILSLPQELRRKKKYN